LKSLVRVCLVALVASQGFAATLWYNGDFDGRSGLINGVNVNGVTSTQNVYEDFIVPVGQTWTIGDAWSNNLMGFTGVTSAVWEIRSGVSTGNGGTLIASGTDSATQTATGNNGFGLVEYQIMVSGLNVTLGAGTYWLSVAPVGDGSGAESFVSTTSGANCVGTPCGNDGNSYWTGGAPFNSNFVPTSDPTAFGPGTWDLSMGVDGLAAPEPATVGLCLAGLGLIAIGSRSRRRVRQ
jgi:hypothetical protein